MIGVGMHAAVGIVPPPTSLRYAVNSGRCAEDQRAELHVEAGVSCRKEPALGCWTRGRVGRRAKEAGQGWGWRDVGNEMAGRVRVPMRRAGEGGVDMVALAA